MPRKGTANFSSFIHLLIAFYTYRPNAADFSLSGTLAEMKETSEGCWRDYTVWTRKNYPRSFYEMNNLITRISWTTTTTTPVLNVFFFFFSSLYLSLTLFSPRSLTNFPTNTTFLTLPFICSIWCSQYDFGHLLYSHILCPVFSSISINSIFHTPQNKS
jgi:hypothetical protein